MTRIALRGKYGKGKFATVDGDMFEYLNQKKYLGQYSDIETALSARKQGEEIYYSL